MSTITTPYDEDSTHERDEPNAWWTTLKHQGVLLSPIVLEEIFPGGPPAPEEGTHERLRKRHRQFRTDPEDELYGWLDGVFEDLLGYPASRWEKEHNVPPEFTDGDLRPNRVLLEDSETVEVDEEGEESAEDDSPSARALVWIDDDRVTTDEGEPGRIGIYSGKRQHARLVKLLRATGVPIGILTNGHQFRVVHATLDQESWTEWEASAWFEGGEGRTALRGFYGLLSEEVLPSPVEDEEGSLVGRIQASRDRQADLSDVMGTQVREAVELLLQELDDVLMQVDEETREEILAPLRELDMGRRDELRARYQASIRIVMRLVVALYAESRELFPKGNPIYFESYSIEGLFRDLREARIEEGEDALDQQFSAWPRLQALSRLVYHGSPHKDVPMRGYGGRLFRPPEEDGDDEVLAALSAFEHDEVKISDAAMLEVLEKLKIAKFRSGGEARTGPVDFSDLRTEYIGMMYEGLLDYDLREATEDDGAIIFLNIGDEPALPFNVLENLDDDGMAKLVDNLKDNSSGDFLADEEATEADIEDEDDEQAVDSDDLGQEFADDLEARVQRWAKEVVEETGVYMPHANTVKAMDPTVRDRVENEAAKKLVDRIIRPGGTYLVSWSGTRKSTGTFYTPPGLAVPTVHRTLEPLAYDEEKDGAQAPKEPEEILELQVCDPAMGSGTFPVAALNYLTQALKESFEHHVFPEIDDGDPIAAPLGETAKGLLNERLLQIRKGEDEHWEDRLEIQLKRAVVERCIYGVDINPLAVELGKLSLWIETLDPDLPFTFLDHKLRVGNSLIGAWLHQFEHYPVAAWNREGGDGRQGERTKRIKSFRNGALKEQMQTYIRENLNETHWFEPESADQTDGLLQQARKAFDDLHESIDESERERLYREEFQENEDIQTLRHLMDRWCAVWFWSMDSDDAPILDPETFYSANRDEEIESIVQELADRRKLKFFHWEIEFPDVFTGTNRGFDAVVGNPPWDKEKTNSLEFFTRYRPEFRTYGKQQAKKVRKSLFDAQPEIEKEWLDNVEYYKGLSNYITYSSSPWDVPLARGKKSKQLKREWREIRKRGRESFEVPFQYQGSADLNSYKMFGEKFHFLAKNGGRIGAIVPSGIYSDYGNQDLRKLFLEKSQWEWIYSFENRNGIFDIHRSYKFSAITLESGGQTSDLKCRFMVHDLSEWNREKEPEHIIQPKEQVDQFSPEVRSVLEVNNQKDVEILGGIYENGSPIGDLDISYDREVDMTNDSGLFCTQEDIEEENIEITSKGIGFKDNEPVALPLLEGRHIDCFDYQYSAHISGHGRTAQWDELDWTQKYLKPQYWIKTNDILNELEFFDYKVGFMDVTSASNRRTVRASVVPPFPCGNKVPVLREESYNLEDYFVLSAVLNSYALDYVARFKLQGLSANWYIVKSFPLPELGDEKQDQLIELSKKLHAPIPNADVNSGSVEFSWPKRNALQDELERAKVREEIDDIVAKSYGLTDEDMRWILRPDNDDPRNLWKDYKERLKIFGGEGKWGSLPEDEADELEEATT